MDVMSAREFPVCALYLELNRGDVDVNVSPAKTEVHFLEPSRVRGFIIRVIRDALSKTLADKVAENMMVNNSIPEILPNAPVNPQIKNFDFKINNSVVRSSDLKKSINIFSDTSTDKFEAKPLKNYQENEFDFPLGRIIGQFANKYIIAQNNEGLVIVDQHAAHERIVYENLRGKKIKVQPLLTPIVFNLRPEKIMALLEIAEELKSSGVLIDKFGEDSLAVFEKPADWDLDWEKLMNLIADEVMVNGHSSMLQEKLHLKLANFACHHSVRAGQKLDFNQMNALLRDIENMERAGQCNHGRPVYKIMSISQLDLMFERI